MLNSFLNKTILSAIGAGLFFFASPVWGELIMCQPDSPLGSEVNPFANNNGMIPPPDEYEGPFFQMSFDYPEGPPPHRGMMGMGTITLVQSIMGAILVIRFPKDIPDILG